ncbi:MAG: hypothetical protein EOL87_08465 [Spartobacteria bacterium]|nr:hypothetical protein [Spartobacteria bacterium]
MKDVQTMDKTINLLVQLQDLMDARSQQEATDTRGRLEQLDGSIEAYKKLLPEDIVSTYLRIRQHHDVAIVPISGQVCTGCGMTLPVAMVHQVKAAQDLILCPTCTRMLFYPAQDLPRRIPQEMNRFGSAPKIGLSRFSSEKLMLPHTKAQSKEDVFNEICTMLQENDYIDDQAALFEAAMRREAIVSTALEHGLAFPHVRGVEGGGLTLACATSEAGFAFDAGEKNLTHIVFFVVIPTAASAFYLKLLSGLTRTFQKKAARDRVAAYNDQDKLWKGLCSLTKNTIK